MQIRDYASKKFPKAEILFKEQIIGIFRRAFKDAPYRKVFSKLYFDLQDLKKYHNLHMKTRWEAEGGFKITLEEWERICTQQSLTTSSPSWREFSWKNVTLFFCTPAQKSKYSNQTTCWRSCGHALANFFGIVHLWLHFGEVSRTYWRQSLRGNLFQFQNNVSGRSGRALFSEV